MINNSNSTSSTSIAIAVAAVSSTVVTLAVAALAYRELKERAIREERSRWVQAEIESQQEARQDDQVLPSIISHFHAFELHYGASIEEANKKRTTKYYEMARDAHKYDLVPSIRSYPRLRNKREQELKRIYRYRDQNKSHRTVIVMCDQVTSEMLDQARTDILRPLNYSHDIATPEVWIPQPNVIPKQHLHVTVAIPWWWHGIREGNAELSQELVARFRQALVTEFHHPFQLELERIVLLGGKTLVGLWRCVGEREAPDHDFIIFDRHGEGQDPLVKLRRDIVQCFTSENNRWGQQPLTYSHRHYDGATNGTTNANATTQHRPSENASLRSTAAKLPGAGAGAGGDLPEEEEEAPRKKLERRNTIELKTPGLGDHDGFIHTTLARLPIDCLSMTDVELEPIHRLCREATATYCGHRMVVSKFRFLETTGEGGESDPCEAPIFDETVEAPAKVEVQGLTGDIQQLVDLHASKIVDRSATIGNLPPTHSPKPSIMDGQLFDEPTTSTTTTTTTTALLTTRAATTGTTTTIRTLTTPTPTPMQGGFNPQEVASAIAAIDSAAKSAASSPGYPLKPIHPLKK